MQINQTKPIHIITMLRKVIIPVLFVGAVYGATLPLTLQPEFGNAVQVELPAAGTVGDLMAEAEEHGMHEVSFQGQKLLDPMVPLADIGVCAETVIETSQMIWNVHNLDSLKPIFKAEIQCDDGSTRCELWQWRASFGFDEANTYSVVMPVYQVRRNETIDRWEVFGYTQIFLDLDLSPGHKFPWGGSYQMVIDNEPRRRTVILKGIVLGRGPNITLSN